MGQSTVFDTFKGEYFTGLRTAAIYSFEFCFKRQIKAAVVKYVGGELEKTANRFYREQDSMGPVSSYFFTLSPAIYLREWIQKSSRSYKMLLNFGKDRP
jgi:hypothetical protein